MSTLLFALFIGFISAFPLVIGAWLALKWEVPSRVVGLVSAFGAGALISAVAFELILEAASQNNLFILSVAIALGAITYFLGSEYLESRRKAGGPTVRGLSLLMGATLDGVPESFLLGISIVGGAGVSIPFFIAVIVSNLPEGMASAAELKTDSYYSLKRIIVMWLAVVALSVIAAGLGAYTGEKLSAIGPFAQAFAAGALLTMLTDDLIPEARERAGLGAGLAVVFGFSVAFALHQLG